VGAELLPVVFLMGSTASGKTETAARLYRELNCEIVSVDAAQVYRGMDIGTAKPDAAFLGEFPHHLIDIRNIDQPYSAADFVTDANRLIAGINGRGRLPLFVGGTMFYFNALEHGLSPLPPANVKIRAKLEKELNANGLAALYRRLVAIDPNISDRIKPGDTQRILRALEIYHLSNTLPSKMMAQSKNMGLTAPLIKLALFAGDRKRLHRRIAARFESMIEQGLVDEVEKLLLDTGSPQNLPAMRAVGYRQVLEYLLNGISYDEMKDNGIAATRQLAKRQLTWLRNQSNVVWFNNDHPQIMDSLVQFMGANSLLDRQ
jgi:tRNA dimethylallyltransferase